MKPESTKSPRLLVVDDDRDHLALVERWLTLAGFDVTGAESGETALAVLEAQRPDLVITDLVMTGIDGIRLLREIHRHDPVMPVIIMSGQAGIPDAVKATHLGASAFLTKPIQREALIAEVGQALSAHSSAQGGGVDGFAPKLVHRSQLMAELLGRARLVAAVDTTVLITGETGTGKEVLAEAIHAGSPRAEAPFVAINCSALPEELLESELFGHEKGAFTGAVNRHEGLFQAADGGTLFLDEIGDMPLALQAKLLRVLQDFKVRPVGSTRAIPVDVRIISATHHNLEQLVEQGDFREDLFYRLSVVPLHMPSLRERREDIPLLVDHFLRKVAGRTGRRAKRFAPDALRHLIGADLPGNVRQLQNLVEQCSVLSPSDIIPVALTAQALREKPAQIPSLDEAKQAFERRYLIGVLRAAEGNITIAARLAGRNRTEFYKLLGRHNLDPTRFRLRGANKDRRDDDEPAPDVRQESA
ncbi:MAG: sigma 54-interacting transcriptional regulator [Chromatiaceae bacterium]|jgi:two-component system response regulator GlrR|nr:sigma 54-interacting transcriptional regulator [Chromatiaceae bacterium]